MKNSFLNQLASEIVNTDKVDYSNTIVIVPNQRAGVLLLKDMHQILDKAFIAPEILTLSDVNELCSPFVVAKDLTLLAELYLVHLEIEKQPKDFFTFQKWGTQLINDFRDIDTYLLDTKKVFVDLENIMQLEGWDIGNWSYSNSKNLSSTQKENISFWKKLPEYYHKFKQNLSAKNIAYSGMVMRYIVEHAESLEVFSNKEIFVAGFSAISNAEEQFFISLTKSYDAKIYWDVDAFYIDNPIHEAGYFYRRYDKKLPKNNWVSNNFNTISKNIELVSTNNNYNQTVAAGQIIEQYEKINSVAVVLGDEDLLMPLLNNLPDTIPVNITMGLSLKQLNIQQLYNHLFILHENYEQYNRQRFYYKDVINVLDNDWIDKHLLLDFKQYIQKTNHLFLSFEDLNKIILDENILNLFTVVKQGTILIKLLLKFLIAQSTDDNKVVKNDIKYQIVQQFEQVCNEFFDEVAPYRDFIDSLKNIKQLFLNQLRSAKLSFQGDKTSGVQIMGLLEARMLDFKNIIFLSVNEGVMPSSSKSNSLIPYDVRRYHQIPTRKEQEALFSYNFYRLLQRCENAHLIFTETQEENEPSRYINQLRLAFKEAKHVTFNKIDLSLSVPSNDKAIHEVKKTPEMLSYLKSYLEHGISPSALNTYLACPYDFYVKYVLQIKEPKEIEESADHSTFGTIIHDTLEFLITPYLKRPLTKNDIAICVKNIETALFDNFQTHFAETSIKSGRNLLLFEVAKKYLEDFFDQELAIIENNIMTIHALEDTLVFDGETEQGYKYKLKGKVDRLDSLNGLYRVIDYKSGNVNNTDISFKNHELINKPKALQLGCYGLMAHQKYPEISSFQLSIYSFKNAKQGYMLAKIDKETSFSKNELVSVKEDVEDVINEILNENVPFSHNEQSKYCKFCY